LHARVERAISPHVCPTTTQAMGLFTKKDRASPQGVL
jgi:hypothetical protein